MKYIKNLFPLLLMFFCINAFAQEFHTANIKVEYEQETGTLNITARTFTDQLEKVLATESSNKSTFESKLKSYANDNIDVKVNGTSLGTSYYGYQVNDKSTRIFFKFEKIPDINSIELKISLLTDVFADQQNIVTFDIKNKKNTIFLTKQNTVASFTF